MAKIIIRILKGACFLLAVLWLGLIVWAQSECPINSPPVGECRMGGGDIWLLPILYSLVGIPAVIASIIIVIVAMVRRKAGQKRMDAGNLTTPSN
jgi:hypothetical protein